MVLAGRAVELHPEFCRQAVDTGLTEAERKFFQKARQLDNLDSDEEEDAGDEVAEFSNEIQLDKHDEEYLWRDKYQPRKPRFFNRVFTGFEWNTYNRTHYDRDNPPPKMVQGARAGGVACWLCSCGFIFFFFFFLVSYTTLSQPPFPLPLFLIFFPPPGYKFNIFYPDLIDRTQTPSFTLTSLKDEPGFAIIRFSAGPPYEDLAFKIVDRKWSHGRRSGYRCDTSGEDACRAARHRNAAPLTFPRLLPLSPLCAAGASSRITTSLSCTFASTASGTAGRRPPFALNATPLIGLFLAPLGRGRGRPCDSGPPPVATWRDSCERMSSRYSYQLRAKGQR